MANDPCAEVELLLQADLDGELTPAEAARIGAHVSGCAHCSAAQTQLLALSERIRTDVPRYELPAGLEARVRQAIADASPAVRVVPAVSPGRWRKPASFAGGFALAACIALVLVLPHAGDTLTAPVTGDVIASHIRALQPGHLMDVTSTDQHTVKPWFDGRIDFAPPVKDLAAARFPLLGGRLDYLAGHPVAALVYGRDKHLIDLFVWPEGRTSPPGIGSGSGYNVQHWAQDGMVFWAVSDLNAAELGTFARLWQDG